MQFLSFKDLRYLRFLLLNSSPPAQTGRKKRFFTEDSEGNKDLQFLSFKDPSLSSLPSVKIPLRWRRPAAKRDFLQKTTKETKICSFCLLKTLRYLRFLLLNCYWGLRRAFFLLLNCYRLAQIGPASRIFTEGDEENEDPSWGPRKSASLPSFPLLLVFIGLKKC